VVFTEEYKRCRPQKRDAQAAEGVGTRGLDLRGQGAEDRSVIDLLRNVVAAVLRFFAPRAVVGVEGLRGRVT
jgi:hypothetical protein